MQQNPIKKRTRIMAAVLCLAAVAFALRLIRMQIVDADTYSELAKRRSVTTQTVAAARGEIVDRYGRPMAVNQTGFNIVFDRTLLPRDQLNDTILRLAGILSQEGEEWYDNLPLEKEAPYGFMENMDSRVAALKRNMQVNSAATAEDVWYWLVQEYELESYTPAEQRVIAGVRYEMVQRGYSYQTPYTFAEDISISTVTKIKEESYAMPGVDVQESSIRSYACGDLAAHLIGRTGFIDADEMEEYKEQGYEANAIVGKEGVEKAFESVLRGEDGERQITMNKGVVVDIKETKTPQPGNTVVLTLDKELQRVTQESLERQIKTIRQTTTINNGMNATVGAAVAIHVPTGEVLACASYPSYDLSTYYKDYQENAGNPEQPFFNRALYGTYAPGSAFKPCVATGVLNEGIMAKDTIVNCVGRYMYYAPSYTPSCMYVNGPINVVNALRVSCNYYFYEAGRLLGIDGIDQYAKGYGLGEPTGIELPESTGRRAGPEYREATGQEWYPGDVIQAAIGQSDHKFTPLQLANYAATIANGGVRMKAHLVKSVVSYNFDETIQEVQPEVAYDMQLKEGVIDTVVEGMVAAAGPGGTSLGKFNDYGVTVAAKTGSPEVDETNLNSVYVAFAPAEDPQIAVAVVIEKGGQGYTGVQVAKEIFDQYFFASAQAQAPQAAETLLP